MLTINFLTKQDYDWSVPYSCLVDTRSIRDAFLESLSHHEDEPEPFMDEDSVKLFEAIYTMKPYKDEQFKRTGAYTIYTYLLGTDTIANLAPDIMLALLLLQNRGSRRRILIADYLNTPAMQYVIRNYDLEVYADVRAAHDYVLSWECNQDIILKHKGEILEDPLSWIDDQCGFNLGKAAEGYTQLTDRKLLLTLDEPTIFQRFCELLSEQGAGLDVSPNHYCDSYIVEVANGIFCLRDETISKYPSIYCILETKENSRFVYYHTVKYPTILEMLYQLIELYQRENIVRLTAVIGTESEAQFAGGFIKELEYGVEIDRKRQKISVMESTAAVIRFCKAAKEADIPPQQSPETIDKSLWRDTK